MVNAPTLDPAYTDLYDTYANEDLCLTQTYFSNFFSNSTDPTYSNDSYNACYNFASSLATQGLSLLQVFYIKSLRLELSYYQQELNDTGGDYV